MKIHSLDSGRRIFTKKYRSVDLTVAGVTANATQLMFRPPTGTKWYVKQVYTHVRDVAGTVTDAPNITIDNGTDTENFVAAVDLGTAEDAFKQHTLASTTRILDHDHPLRLKSNDGADGSTTFLVDVIVELIQITGG